MAHKAQRTTTPWRKRYLVDLRSGEVFLLRGKAKRINPYRHAYLCSPDGRSWYWRTDYSPHAIVDDIVGLVALRLDGVNIASEPRWKSHT